MAAITIGSQYSGHTLLMEGTCAYHATFSVSWYINLVYCLKNILQAICKMQVTLVTLQSCSIFWHFLLLSWPLWSWSYGSWIYNYVWNRCLSPLKLWFRIPPSRGVLNTTLSNKVCQWLAAVFSRYYHFLTNKTDGHDATEILLKVTLNTITFYNHW